MGLIEESEDNPGWSLEGGKGTVSTINGRLELTFEAASIRITRPVSWTASRVDRLDLELGAGWTAGERIRLFWAAPGGSFVPEQRLVQAIGRDGSASFDLLSLRHWSGPIAALRLDLPGQPGSSRTLGSIQAVRYEYPPEELASLVARAWDVLVDDEERAARVSAPDHPVVWDLDRPSTTGDELRFAYSVLEPSAAASVVRVRSTGGSDPPRTIFETTIERTARPVWNEARVDLTEFGLTETLSFEVASEEGGMSAGLGVWADPSILRPSRRGERPNLVVLSLDTLRADRLSLYGYEKPTSPRVDDWARRRAATFLNTVAASPRTLPSHTSLFTGLDAIRHGVNHYLPAPDELSTLAELLRREGYKTVASTGGGLMGPAFGLDQGFDEYYSYPGWSGGFEELETEMDRVQAKLPLLDPPFFLFFHTFEIHDPFHERAPYSDACYGEGDERKDVIFGALPRPQSARDGYLLHHDLKRWRKGEQVADATTAPQTDLPLVQCLYDSGIAYTDSQVDRLLSRLEDLGLSPDTVVVLTSDHGEAFGEHGLFKHSSLYDDNLMIPLLIAFPDGRFAGQQVTEQVSTVDIVPTILELLDVEPPGPLDGTSLVPLLQGDAEVQRREAWSYASHENRGVSLRIDNRVKYIFNNTAGSSEFGTRELYRLRRDPAELDNLAAKDAVAASHLQRWVRTVSEGRTPSARARFGNRACKRLSGVLGLPALASRIKAFEQPEGAFIAVSEHEAHLSLERGEELEVFVESNAQLSIELKATECDEGPVPDFVTRLDLSTLALGWSAGVGSAGWIESIESPQVPTDKALYALVLPAVGDRGPDREVDDELALQQLRSLGYL